ncbi:MAG: NAD(P)-dependent oxidoreductase [Candidatus Acidiferrales bacterium]|jgi:3-hydroxyisobutyrate dehydrogenase-like beta-hydroxyacid dehydrogenase
MANLGFVGLGVMGGEMVSRLLSKGHTVTGYNRTRAKAQRLIDRGMKWGDSPRAVCAAADVTFSMVTNEKALAAIMEGPDGILSSVAPGKFLIDMSTVSPHYSRSVAAKAREKGADMIDAPVSGSVITLQEGKLSVMVGGRRETFDRLKPILDDIGPKVTYVGDNGLALAMKIATNLSLAVQMMAFCEGVLLAEKSGIARAVAVDVLTNSAIASPMIKYRGPFVLTMPAEAWFDVNMMQKDMMLALDMGRALDVPLPTTAVSNEFLTAARGMGFAKQDFAVVFEVLARMSGVAK